jgi:hypothetical protein
VCLVAEEVDPGKVFAAGVNGGWWRCVDTCDYNKLGKVCPVRSSVYPKCSHPQNLLNCTRSCTRDSTTPLGTRRRRRHIKNTAPPPVAINTQTPPPLLRYYSYTLLRYYSYTIRIYYTPEGGGSLPSSVRERCARHLTLFLYYIRSYLLLFLYYIRLEGSRGGILSSSRLRIRLSSSRITA